VSLQQKEVQVAAVTEVEETSGPKSQSWKHEAMVDWINSTYGVDLDTLTAAEIVAYAFAYRNAWRATDTYRSLIDGRKGQAEAEKAERKAARDAAAAERKAAAAAEKAAAKKAAPAKAAAKKAPAKAAAKKAPAKKAAATTGDNPFE
jgi:hypothetical protein